MKKSQKKKPQAGDTAPQADQRPSPLWHNRVPWLVMVVALVPRLIMLHSVETSPLAGVLLGDSEGYVLWAQSIVAGPWLGTEVFYQAPLYPYFLAAVIALFGKSFLAIRIIQIVLGVAACGFIAAAGKKLFGPGAGLAAGLLIALYPPSWYFDVLLQKSSLDGFFLAVLLWAVASAVAHPSAPNSILMGAAIAALALTRENALALLPVLGAWLFYRTRKDWHGALVMVGLFLAGATAVLAPVAFRNLAIGGEFHITTSQLGTNLYIGNNPLANGRYVPLPNCRGNWRYEREDARRLAEEALGRSLTDREVSRYWVSRTLEFISENPGKELQLLHLKFLLAINRTEIGDTDSQYLFADYSLLLRGAQSFWHFGVLFPLAALSLISWKRDRKALIPLLLIFGTLLGGLVVFYVLGRYRYPLVPPLILMAALGAHNLFSAFRERLWVHVFASAGIAAGAAFLANWPVIDSRTFLAGGRYNLAGELVKAGRGTEAMGLYQAAINANPRFPDAHNNLGYLLATHGGIEEARRHFEAALEHDPAHPDANLNLGRTLTRQGQPSEAVVYLEKALEASPEDADAHVELGDALLKINKPAEALPHFERAVKVDPGFADANLGLGTVLHKMGQPEKALAFLETAVTLSPRRIDARLELASVLNQLGRQREALDQYHEVLKRDGRNVDALQGVVRLNPAVSR